MPPEVKQALGENKMLYSVIGYYSLILGLFFGLVIFYFSAIKNFRNSRNY